MDPEELRTIQAHLYVLSYLQLHLSVYPAAWIIKHTRSDFIYVFIRERSRYTVVQVIAWFVVFTFIFPPFISRSLLPYECKEHKYNVTSVNRESHLSLFHAKVDGCELQDALRDWSNIRVIGPVLFISAVVLSLLLGKAFEYSRKWQRRVLSFAKPMLPRLFYNGLGPAKSDSSAWHLMEKQGLSHHWSFWHDSLGTLDLIVASIALVLTIFVGFVGIGYMFDNRSDTGYLGATLGAASGAAVVRVMLYVLNYALGASGQLISYIDEQLHGFQPYKKVLGPDGIKKEQVREQVQQAADLVRAHGEKSRQRSDWKGEDVEVLAQRIEAGGFDVIKNVVDWLAKKKESLFSVQNVCFYLFNTQTTFSTDEYGIASLSMMDIPLFLATYYDPTWKVLGNFVHYNKEKWTPCLNLTTVYTGYPRQLLCKLTQDGRWKIARFNSEQALQEMEDVDDIISTMSLRSTYSPPELPDSIVGEAT